MSTRKKVTLVMQAVDNFSSPLKDIASATKGYGKIAKKVTEQQRNINKKIGDISAYKKLNRGLDDTSYNLKIASRRSVELAKKINKIDKPTAVMTRAFNTAKRAEDKLRKSHTKQTDALKKLQRELTDAKVDTNDFTAAQERLERQQKAVDRRMRVGKVVDKGKDFTKRTAGKAAQVAKKSAYVATGLFAGFTYLFKTQFIDTAAQFEKYETVLTNAEGSLVKAKKSMAWIKEFGATTPYEIDGVTEAFVSLRSKGIDPTDGLLRTLGDTAASMDKPLMQAVEAIIDARQGETDRLKELGITSSKSGEQITFEYTNKAGEQLTKTVSKNNRKMIQDTLVTIWDEKFGDAMNKLSATWSGMLSNLSDHWKNFILLVMENGLFDRMKERLKGLLDKINEMAANGELEAKAKQFGNLLMDSFDKGMEAAKTIMDLVEKSSALIDKINNFFGSNDEDPAKAKARAERKQAQEIVRANIQKARENKVAAANDMYMNMGKPNLKIVKAEQNIQPIATRKREGNVSNATNITQHNTFKIQATQGMNEQQLAKKVAVEVKRLSEAEHSRRSYD